MCQVCSVCSERAPIVRLIGEFGIRDSEAEADSIDCRWFWQFGDGDIDITTTTDFNGITKELVSRVVCQSIEQRIYDDCRIVNFVRENSFNILVGNCTDQAVCGQKIIHI